MPNDPVPRSHSPNEAHSAGGGTPPKAGPLNRLRGTAAPKDTIPIVGKTPRKQRSSRFHVVEHVELEKLPGFNGQYMLILWPFLLS
jgi:serine/threonine-protein phosphatase 2A regulatory subunit B'